MSSITATPVDPRRASVYMRDALLFAVCYLLLDWASYLHPLGPFNITLWNPPPALSIAWILLGGMGHAPAILVTVTIADVIIRQAPGGILLSVITSLAVAVAYVGIAGILRLWVLPEGRIRDTRQLGIFTMVATAGTALVGLLYVGILWAAGFRVGDSFNDAVLRYWLGDIVGILVTTPLLLVFANGESRRRFLALWRRPETSLQFATMIAAIYYVFESYGGDPSKYFYALFLPLIWIAVRCGLAGAVAASAIVQAGVVFIAHADEGLQSVAVAELQALVAALSLTGMFLGVLLDQRDRAEEDLKQSLRLAAAGEMAGAIAHEINQPLGALMNYGRACQLLLGRLVPQAQSTELSAALDRMLGEARRAAEVVARLRDFFRSGTTRLESVPVTALIATARSIGEGLNAECGIDFTVEDLPAPDSVLADRLQIELILRNLVANAFEAVTNPSLPRRAVTIKARKLEGARLLVSVSDSGSGVPLALRDRLFMPFSTNKSKGMGLGLAISRAIAEAHGGSLVATGDGSSEFQLILPLQDRHD